MSEQFNLLLQHLYPKRAITDFARWVASSQAGGITTAIIRRFVRRYNVNMNEAANSDIRSYKSFNDFFTRALRDDVRPIADADYVCPVDGAISQFGSIERDQIFQAKGHHYSTAALLAGDNAWAAQFQDGQFATLYLSPRDYHRIHMPCDGQLMRMIYVPGTLYSVNPATARGIPGLFARNERVVCEFNGTHGNFALVLVGAAIVGSMATVWHGQVNPPRYRDVKAWSYTDQNIHLKKGQEMGRFLLGSTVVMLFPRQALTFNAEWQSDRQICMGEMMGVAPAVRK